MAGRIYFAGIYMTKGVPNLERGFDRPKLGTPFSFLRCFPFCGRVLRTAPLDKTPDFAQYVQKSGVFLFQKEKSIAKKQSRHYTDKRNE